MFETRWLTPAHAALIKEARMYRRERPPRWSEPSPRGRHQPAHRRSR